MKIVLHNPGHNGDHFFTLGIVKHFIDFNLDKHFVIVSACSSHLFNELLNNNVTIEEHPVIWNNDKNIFNNTNFISENHDILWNYKNGDIYINMWKLLIQNNYNCISLVNRPKFIKDTLKVIYANTGILINFNIEDYKELIPILPKINFDFIANKLKSYNKKIIFFYNQNSYCGIEKSYTSNINNATIQELINKHGDDHIIILSKPSNIIHKNLIDVETEFGNLPVLNGKNLIINTQIANMCDEVYFKNNGGSLFILNQQNIANRNVKYHFIGSNEWKNIYLNEYDLNCNF
jgi:hypothetical protein